MKNVLKVFAVVLVVFCIVVSCSKKTGGSGSSGGSSNDAGGNTATGSSNAGNSNSGAKNGIKITVTGLSSRDYNGRELRLYLLDKDNFETVAEAYDKIENGKVDLYFFKYQEEGNPWTQTGEYYIRASLFGLRNMWYTNGKGFVELGLARRVGESTRIEFFNFQEDETFKNFPTFDLKANGNEIDGSKFEGVPEYGQQ